MTIERQSDSQANSGARRAYHHGDLRAALIEAGLKLLEQGTELPGLRAAARAVGVSSMAVYRHFPDKLTLLRAMAHEGLERLAAAQEAAIERAAGPLEAFNASGHAYVRFALANPALYRLIFTTAAPSDQFGAPHEALSRPMQLLRSCIERVAGDRLSAEGQRLFALRAWSTVHGLAMLALDRQIAPEIVEREVARLIDAGSLSAGLR